MDIPFLPYERLRPIADRFIEDHNPSREVPVHIERIIDNRFQIDIVPTPGLHRAFDIDSFITSDFSEIHVDEFVYESRPRRYRFSLAHELSHFLIHQDVFRQLSFSTIQEWKDAVTSIPEREYGLLEFQANSLAGLILVPPQELGAEFGEAIARAERMGLAMSDMTDAGREIVEASLADKFNVSSAVIHRRAEFDELWES